MATLRAVYVSLLAAVALCLALHPVVPQWAAGLAWLGANVLALADAMMQPQVEREP